LEKVSEIMSASALSRFLEKSWDKYSVDIPHAKQVMRLSGILFDEPVIKKLHNLGERERDILLASAGLHDVGISISLKGHHKHSLEIISKMDIPGFSRDEVITIANIARYHRKSHPSEEHPYFRKLSQDNKRLVCKLASLLRIADGLDRMHDSSVVNIHCNMKKDEIEMVIETTGLVIEEVLYSKSSLFVETYMKGVLFKIE